MPRCGPWCGGPCPRRARARAARPASPGPGGRRRLAASGEALASSGCSAEQPVAAGQLAPRRATRRRRPGPARDEGSHASLERLTQVAGGRRLALDGGRDAGRARWTIVDSTCLKNSPVPTNSCQRASTSPRSRVPSVMPSSTWPRRSPYAAWAACAARRPPAPGPRWPRRARGRARRASRGRREGLADHDRAGRASLARAVATNAGGRRPARAGGPQRQLGLGDAEDGAVDKPCSRSIEARWLRMSAIASGGTRSSTMAMAVPRSEASRSRSQGTASA